MTSLNFSGKIVSADALVKMTSETPAENKEEKLDSGAQVWACTVCGHERQWGDGIPLNKDQKKLGCDHCKQVTPHKYLRVHWTI